MFGDAESLDCERYGRAMVLKEWGVQAQKLISESSILLVGAGGLGSTIALYLAGAGVGCLGIVDGDTVELSNLHRQVIHTHKSIGENKAKSAALACHALNISAQIKSYAYFLDNISANKIIPQYDVIVDGTDNPSAKYLLNDACVIHNKPLISGSALYWEGQMTVYNYNNGPCYRCIFPQPPPKASINGCDIAGVIGPIPGLIGTIQALECLKVCGGIKEHVFSGRLLIFDALNIAQPWRSIKLRSKRTDCEVCGTNPSIKSLTLYDSVSNLCPTNLQLPDLPYENKISPKEFICRFPNILTNLQPSKEDSQLIIIDVRPSSHFKIAHLPKSINWPLEDLSYETSVENLIEKCDIAQTLNPLSIVVVCRRGNDSTHATHKLLMLTSCSSTLPSLCILNLQGGLRSLRQYIPQFPLP